MNLKFYRPRVEFNWKHFFVVALPWGHKSHGWPGYAGPAQRVVMIRRPGSRSPLPRFLLTYIGRVA